MLRHAIAPARFFTQVSNDIIRHPRLSSDAVRLLTWQLSLPGGDDEALSRTAARAGIGKCAFLRAKRELIAERYFHEWREQGVRGLWSTVRLVSNVPLGGEEAAALRAPAHVAVPDSAPAGGSPAVGEPTGRAVGRHPEPPVPENTSHRPAPPARATAEQQAVARELVDSLGGLDARLRVPRGILPELAALAAEWLACGHTVADVREQVRRCLPGRGQPIHRPGGLVRYVLREIPPVVMPITAAPVTVDDALAWRARHDTMLRRRVTATYRRELAGVDLDEVAAAGQAACIAPPHRPHPERLPLPVQPSRNRSGRRHVLRCMISDRVSRVNSESCGRVIRTVLLAEAEAVAALHARARATYYPDGIPDDGTEWLAAWRGAIERPDGHVLCVVVRGRITGIASFRTPEDAPEETVKLFQFHVDPDHWRSGVGTALHAACVEEWWADGKQTALLDVHVDNRRAQAFYARQGWVPDPENPRAEGDHHLFLRYAVTGE